MVFDKGYITWNKGEKCKLSPHFWSQEFSCHCTNQECIQQKVSLSLLNSLEAVRTTMGLPLKVTSGYRCQQHQQSLRDLGFETSKGPSQHELGNAADIQAASMHELLTQCKLQFLAVGVSHYFIHVDTRPDKGRYWSYLNT